MVTIGVDGCKCGWFFVRLEGATFEVGVVSTIEALIASVPDGSLLLIDIPIGLQDKCSAARGCDTAARKLLGRPRSSSVFPAPLRAVLRESSHAAASRKSRRLSEKGLSRQAFGIMPKIREVDELLATNARARSMLRESHPELCFWAFAGKQAMRHAKKTEAGFAERMDLLQQVLPGSKDVAAAALQRFLRKDVARDDVADALVLAATAAAPLESLLTAPLEPQRDSRGLPMEIVYTWDSETPSGA